MSTPAMAVDDSPFVMELLWKGASALERSKLGHVFERLRAVPRKLDSHVYHAELIEILEEYDHLNWPNHFQLHGVAPDFQRHVSMWTEADQVDAVQRQSYMKLESGGCRRHLDIAYGLSDKLDLSNEEEFVEQLVAMGRREYTSPVPEASHLDNLVLHVAVSYKHQARWDGGGTMSEAQARAVWSSLKSIFLFEKAKAVRVWVDQNLHRAKFEERVEWHEYGLLPYACLPIVFIGDGDCSLRHAETRPWLWVELIAGVKAHGVHAVEGHDLLEEAAACLEITDRYKAASQQLQKRGHIMSQARDVDDIMLEVARLVSFWRPDGFLKHEGYEYKKYFLSFVNWSRRFVLRGCPYSKMQWNHSSEPVHGMDAVVLIRALPRTSDGIIESSSALIEPRIEWQRKSMKTADSSGAIIASDNDFSKVWTVGDLFDRTKIDMLPLVYIVEFEVHGNEIVILEKTSAINRIRFRKLGNIVKTTISKDDAVGSPLRLTRRGLSNFVMFEQLCGSSPMFVMSTVRAHSDLITYRPFTERFMLARRNGLHVIGDAELIPQKLSDGTKTALKLECIGVNVDKGICEEVYRMNLVHGLEMTLSCSEVGALLAASRRNISAFAHLAINLKKNCEYKNIWLRDTSIVERLQSTAGWRMDDFGEMLNEHIMSGECDTDIHDEFVEECRRRYPDCTFVTIRKFDPTTVRLVYRTERHITQFRCTNIASRSELAIIKLIDGIELMDPNGTGVLQILTSIYNWRDGAAMREITMKMLPGLFAKCTACDSTVCVVNGLTAQLTMEQNNEKYCVKWITEHTCENYVLEDVVVTAGAPTQFDA